jgi:hypothetical protein
MHRVLLAFLSASLVTAADPALLKLIMPDAALIAGANVERIKKTAFGQHVFSQLPADDDSFQSFKVATGFDPQRDLEEILVATPQGSGAKREGLLVVRGRFDLDRIRPFLNSISTLKRESVNGIDVFLPAGSGPKAFAFLNPSLAVAGELEYVRAAVSQTGLAAPAPALAAKALDLSTSQDAWFVTSNAAALTSGFDDRRVQGAVKGDLFKAIDESSGGVVFGELARFTGQATLKTGEDAAALADVTKFMFNLLQAQGTKGTLGELVGSVQGFDASAAGNQVNIVFSVPESQLESLLGRRGSRLLGEAGGQARKEPRASTVELTPAAHPSASAR